MQCQNIDSINWIKSVILIVIRGGLVMVRSERIEFKVGRILFKLNKRKNNEKIYT